MFFSMAEVKKANEARGHSWFSPSTMQWFDSRIESEFFPIPETEGVVGYFIHSQQFHGTDGSGPRRYCVASVDGKGGVEGGVTESRMNYPTLASAAARIIQLTKRRR